MNYIHEILHNDEKSDMVTEHDNGQQPDQCDLCECNPGNTHAVKSAQMNLSRATILPSKLDLGAF